MNPPANWYPDPTGRHGQRYWDGAQWTEHVFTDGVQGVDPLEADAASSEDATADAGVDTAVDTGTGGQAASGTSVPAELPRRQRRTASSEAQVDEPMEGAEGLFGGDADGQGEQPGDAPAPTDQPAATDGDAPDTSATTTWSPDEPAARDADESVAPDVEPEDVVATVDEATEGGGPDFSDAFVLAPETASRLVRRAEPGEELAEEASEDADGAPESSDTAELAADGTTETDDGDVALDDGAAEPAAMDEQGPGDGDLSSMPAPTAGGPLDAPPAAMAPPPAADAGSLGISGDLVGGAFAEREGGGDVALQNSRMLRCSAATGIIARQGTMVAYQGDVQFERQGAGGVGRALKRAATGEGLAMMRVAGNGDVFFADGGQHVFLLHLEGGRGLSVNGRNVLAFSASLQWDIERVKGASLLAGGLFNTTLTGTGWVALVADGEPVVLRTDEAPTFVDVNALVAWSGGLSTRIVNTVSAKSLVGLGSGEAFQMAFDGAGIVIVQPSEGPMGGAAAT